MKEVKTKPKGTPRTAEIIKAPKRIGRGKDMISAVKNMAKEKLVRKAAREKQEKQKTARAEVQATETVEEAVHSSVNTAYAQGKHTINRGIKRVNKEKKPGQKEPLDIRTETDSKSRVKTKENYLEGQARPPKTVKETRTETVRPQTVSLKNEMLQTNMTPKEKTSEARRKHVVAKIRTEKKGETNLCTQKTNGEVSSHIPQMNTENPMRVDAVKMPIADNTPPMQVKTKEAYLRAMQTNRTEQMKTPHRTSPVTKHVTEQAAKRPENAHRTVKNGQKLSGMRKVKSGNIYSAGKTTRKSIVKLRGTAAKTAEQTVRKTGKEAVKRSAQVAQKALQATKTAAGKTAQAGAKVAQAAAYAIKSLISAIVALGGGGVLLVVLLLVVIVGAVAASPFGIFIAEEAADENSIPLSAIVAECNAELAAQMDSIEAGTPHNRVVVEGETAEWGEILAVFAVKVAGTGDETAQDVVIIDEAKKQMLKEVFWEMHAITSRTETVMSGNTSETVLYISIQQKTKDDMAAQYGFTDKQKEALATLLENNDILLVSTQSLAVSDASAKEILDALPENLSEERKAVIHAACSLVGKVNYFWGGKYNAMGWNPNWGKIMRVTAAGSSTTGSMRPFGLDCSGFVSWVFFNAGFQNGAVGEGTTGQLANSTRISENEAQPGDLTFNSDVSHVGIIAGRDVNGGLLTIHCSSGANNVVILTGSLGTVARPNCYSE